MCFLVERCVLGRKLVPSRMAEGRLGIPSFDLAELGARWATISIGAFRASGLVNKIR